jgi:hypothetical protein
MVHCSWPERVTCQSGDNGSGAGEGEALELQVDLPNQVTGDHLGWGGTRRSWSDAVGGWFAYSYVVGRLDNP